MSSSDAFRSACATYYEYSSDGSASDEQDNGGDEEEDDDPYALENSSCAASPAPLSSAVYENGSDSDSSSADDSNSGEKSGDEEEDNDSYVYYQEGGSENNRNNSKNKTRLDAPLPSSAVGRRKARPTNSDDNSNSSNNNNKNCDQNNNNDTVDTQKKVLSPNALPTQGTVSWNFEFQRLESAFWAASGEPEKMLSISADLQTLVKSFTERAEELGRRIVEEEYVPEEERTVASIDAGGVAGGEKFCANGIFFKVARDPFKLYGGSETNAGKVAQLELKGLMDLQYAQFMVRRQQSPDLPDKSTWLNFPLMCVMNYMGTTIIASGLLPIKGEKTLVYGSADGARTVHADHEGVNATARRLAEFLKLKPHLVGPRTAPENQLTELALPADIEIHAGADGRFYCLDTARVCPAFQPDPTRPRSHLYQLMRSELLQRSDVPISSDAFSGFGRVGADIHNPEASQLCHTLEREIIPSFARWLDSRCNAVEKCPSDVAFVARLADCRELCASLHRLGINIRFLGRIRARCKSPYARSLILAEMVARCCKNRLRDRLRDIRSNAKQRPETIEQLRTELIASELTRWFFGSSGTNGSRLHAGPPEVASPIDDAYDADYAYNSQHGGNVQSMKTNCVEGSHAISEVLYDPYDSDTTSNSCKDGHDPLGNARTSTAADDFNASTDGYDPYELHEPHFKESLGSPANYDPYDTGDLDSCTPEMSAGESPDVSSSSEEYDPYAKGDESALFKNRSSGAESSSAADYDPYGAGDMTSLVHLPAFAVQNALTIESNRNRIVLDFFCNEIKGMVVGMFGAESLSSQETERTVDLSVYAFRPLLVLERIQELLGLKLSVASPLHNAPARLLPQEGEGSSLDEDDILRALPYDIASPLKKATAEILSAGPPLADLKTSNIWKSPTVNELVELDEVSRGCIVMPCSPALLTSSGNTLLVKRRSEPACICATPGFPYFEIAIERAIGTDDGDDNEPPAVAIGFTTSQLPLHGILPGWRQGSYGYHGDDGGIFCGTGSAEGSLDTFGLHDVVGCGLRRKDEGEGVEMFATKNGEVVGLIASFPNLSFDRALLLFRPCVGGTCEFRLLVNAGGIVPFEFTGAPSVHNLIPLNRSPAVRELAEEVSKRRDAEARARQAEWEALDKPITQSDVQSFGAKTKRFWLFDYARAFALAEIALEKHKVEGATNSAVQPLLEDAAASYMQVLALHPSSTRALINAAVSLATLADCERFASNSSERVIALYQRADFAFGQAFLQLASQKTRYDELQGMLHTWAFVAKQLCVWSSNNSFSRPFLLQKLSLMISERSGDNDSDALFVGYDTLGLLCVNAAMASSGMGSRERWYSLAWEAYDKAQAAKFAGHHEYLFSFVNCGLGHNSCATTTDAIAPLKSIATLKQRTEPHFTLAEQNFTIAMERGGLKFAGSGDDMPVPSTVFLATKVFQNWGRMLWSRAQHESNLKLALSVAEDAVTKFQAALAYNPGFFSARRELADIFATMATFLSPVDRTAADAHTVRYLLQAATILREGYKHSPDWIDGLIGARKYLRLVAAYLEERERKGIAIRNNVQYWGALLDIDEIHRECIDVARTARNGIPEQRYLELADEIDLGGSISLRVQSLNDRTARGNIGEDVSQWVEELIEEAIVEYVTSCRSWIQRTVRLVVDEATFTSLLGLTDPTVPGNTLVRLVDGLLATLRTMPAESADYDVNAAVMLPTRIALNGLLNSLLVPAYAEKLVRDEHLLRILHDRNVLAATIPIWAEQSSDAEEILKMCWMCLRNLAAAKPARPHILEDDSLVDSLFSVISSTTAHIIARQTAAATILVMSKPDNNDSARIALLTSGDRCAKLLRGLDIACKEDHGTVASFLSLALAHAAELEATARMCCEVQARDRPTGSCCEASWVFLDCLCGSPNADTSSYVGQWFNLLFQRAGYEQAVNLAKDLRLLAAEHPQGAAALWVAALMTRNQKSLLPLFRAGTVISLLQACLRVLTGESLPTERSYDNAFREATATILTAITADATICRGIDQEALIQAVKTVRDAANSQDDMHRSAVGALQCLTNPQVHVHES